MIEACPRRNFRCVSVGLVDQDMCAQRNQPGMTGHIDTLTRFVGRCAAPGMLHTQTSGTGSSVSISSRPTQLPGAGNDVQLPLATGAVQVGVLQDRKSVV